MLKARIKKTGEELEVVRYNPHAVQCKIAEHDRAIARYRLTEVELFIDDGVNRCKQSPKPQSIEQVQEVEQEAKRRLFVHNKKWLSVKEESDYLGVTEQRVYQLIRQNKLPSYRREKKIHLNIEDLERLKLKASLGKDLHS